MFSNGAAAAPWRCRLKWGWGWQKRTSRRRGGAGCGGGYVGYPTRARRRHGTGAEFLCYLGRRNFWRWVQWCSLCLDAMLLYLDIRLCSMIWLSNVPISKTKGQTAKWSEDLSSACVIWSLHQVSSLYDVRQCGFKGGGWKLGSWNLVL